MLLIQNAEENCLSSYFFLFFWPKLESALSTEGTLNLCKWCILGYGWMIIQ